MKKILLVLPIAMLLAAGCNSTPQAIAPAPLAENNIPSPSPTPTLEPTPSSTASPSVTPSPMPTKTMPVTTIVLTLGNNGQYLTATNGYALYTSSKDTPNVSNCTGVCAGNWPPYIVSSTAQIAAAAGITGKLGHITPGGGPSQLTYKGQPLYFWNGDAKPGDTTGDGVGGFSLAKP